MRLDPISRRLLAGAGRRGAIVLMYHSVAPPGEAISWRYSIPFERFAVQLDLLRATGWHTRRVADLDPTVGDHQVAITFDDGYADNFAAFEALRQRGMVATWFVVTRDIGASSAWEDPDTPSRPMLRADQLRAMAGEGMEIGTHSRSHMRLTGADDQQLRAEVAGSKADLEELLGKGVASFAYPYGDHDARVVDAARAAGYTRACVTRSGWAFSSNDPLAIRRVTVTNSDDAATLARKLAFADNEVSWPRVARYAARRAMARFTGA
jgi:peptidoglycan/xylan/chitin deacetylase (PgdA/CDA1 family)